MFNYTINNSNNFFNKINMSIDNYFLNPSKYTYINNTPFNLDKNSDFDSITETLNSILSLNNDLINNNLNNNIDNIIFKLIANNKINEINDIIKNKKINLNVQDIDGDTPLHIAVFLCNVNICEILLSNNINFFIKDKWGQTALHRICFSISDMNVIKIINLFIKFSNNFEKMNIFNEIDNYGNTPFHLILKNIIKNNIKINNCHIKIINKLKIVTNCKIKNNDNNNIYDLLKLLNI